MKKTMIVLLAGTALFTACKKTDTTTTTTTQKVLGKWAIVSNVSTEKFQGNEHTTTTPGTAADFADFRTDGKIYSHSEGSFDTSSYKIVSDLLISIDGDTAQIKTLTSNSMVLYSKQMFNANDYTEDKTTFKK